MMLFSKKEELPEGGKANVKGLLHNRAYLSLMSAQLISNLGDWLYLLALLTMVGLKWNATPWQITAVSLCMLLPMLLGGPLAGLLSDRVERKRLMIISDLARVMIVLGLVFVTDIWQVYALLIAKGVFDVIFSPAKNGKMKEFVPSEHMEKAVSYSAIIEQGSKIVGPALGGMLTAAFGISACFIINAVSFLISAIILFGVPGKPAKTTVEGPDSCEEAENTNKTGFWHEMAAGMKIIASIPIIAFGTLTLGMAMLVLQIADSQSVVLFREIPGISNDMLGWCITLSGTGTLAAAGLIQLLGRWSPLVKMGTGAALLGIVFALVGVVAVLGPFNAWGYALIMFIFFLAGMGAGMALIPFQVVLQQRTPETLTGRVFGTVTSITSAASVIGPMVGASLVTAFGPQPAFMLSGSLMALIGMLLLIFNPAIMKRDLKSQKVALSA